MEADISVAWQFLSPSDDAWQFTKCLYAYIAPDEEEILYIGKSWCVTIRDRWDREAKEEFWDKLELDRGIDSHFALLGDVTLNYKGRLSNQLLADIESLLIMAERPWGNIQSTESRISRPGLRVECTGTWPGKASYYYDNDSIDA